MEEWYRIRSAGPEDEQGLTDLKSRCIQSLYRGYLPEEVLDRINATHTGQQVHDWLCDEKTCVGLLENGGAESGYVACRPDQDLDGWWLIDDIGADERLPSEQKSGLVKWALQEMQKTASAARTSGSCRIISRGASSWNPSASGRRGK